MRIAIVTSIVCVLFGCGTSQVATSATRTAQTAGENWKQHCAKCHGTDGRGKTEEGKRLQVKDLTDPERQLEMKYIDMVRAIADGVYDSDGKERMRHFGDLLFAKEVHELTVYIRSLSK